MPIPCRRLIILAGFQLLAACARPQARPPEARMANSGLALAASQRGGSRALAAEEGADFDVSLRNQGGATQTVQSLENPFIPNYRVLDAAGNPIEEFNARQRTLRVVGDIGSAEFASTAQITLAAAQNQDTWLGLWAFRDPLPPGKYAFEVVHEPVPGAGFMQSNRVPFEIRAAHVESSAVALDGPARANSVLAWLARVDGSAGLRLLLRQSGFTSHRVAQIGGIAHGEFPAGSRVGLAAMPMDSRLPPLNWAAVVSGTQLRIIQHALAVPQGSPIPPVTLPVSDAVPIPKFPNRGHAVFLATANPPSGPVLVGAVIRSGEPTAKLWTTALKGKPVHTACAFTMQGAISILYSTDDGRTSQLHRLDVQENGAVAVADTVVRESPNEVLAVAADMRVGQPMSFVVAEADRVRHNHLAFVKIPLPGTLAATGLREVAGWPMIAGNRETPEPARASSVAFDLDAAGMPWIAIVTERGDFAGGRLDGSLRLLRDRRARLLWPHAAGLADSMSLSGFEENGMLFHYRVGPDDQ